MIQALLFFATLKGKLAVGAAIVLALVSLRACDVHKQREIGADKAVARMEKAADENAAKAEKARQSIDRVPADRLRDQYRRD